MAKVHVIAIFCKNDTVFGAAQTKVGMRKFVADWCRENWTEDDQHSYGKLPKNDTRCIKKYFSEQVYGDVESWSGEIVELHD